MAVSGAVCRFRGRLPGPGPSAGVGAVCRGRLPGPGPAAGAGAGAVCRGRLPGPGPAPLPGPSAGAGEGIRRLQIGLCTGEVGGGLQRRIVVPVSLGVGWVLGTRTIPTITGAPLRGFARHRGSTLRSPRSLRSALRFSVRSLRSLRALPRLLACSCNGRSGRWSRQQEAKTGGRRLDTGRGDEFRSARTSSAHGRPGGSAGRSGATPERSDKERKSARRAAGAPQRAHG